MGGLPRLVCLCFRVFMALLPSASFSARSAASRARLESPVPSFEKGSAWACVTLSETDATECVGAGGVLSERGESTSLSDQLSRLSISDQLSSPEDDCATELGAADDSSSGGTGRGGTLSNGTSGGSERS